MALHLYNTEGRELQEFIPFTPGKVGMYTCGPTVYNFAHLGNLRTYISEDILHRTLEYFGYEVNHVMNITDVGHLSDDADDGEDKMLKSAREQKSTVYDIAKYYTQAFFSDTGKLNIITPGHTCRATEHIEEMIALIQRLEDNGLTYAAGGNIYFSIDKFPAYGKMAGLDLDDLKAGARVQIDANKHNPLDFVLWFTNSKFEHQTMVWDSPWGRGYPGWHVECSAMSMKYLGEQFEIHCGGVDHIQVHHTNEIAQSEGATGKPWVKYWMHMEFLIGEEGKISKSKGGASLLSDLEKMGFDPLDYRFFCFGGHYRSQMVFSTATIKAASSARANLEERILGILEEKPEVQSLEELSADAKTLLEGFRNAMENDLNVPKALSFLWATVKSTVLSASEQYTLILDMDKIFGLRLDEIIIPEAQDEAHITELIEERKTARVSKNFGRADEIRDALLEMGIIIKDTPDGTQWRVKK